MDRATWQVGPALANCIGNRAGRNTQLRQPVRPDFHADFRLWQSKDPCFADARIARENIDQIIRIFFHPPPRSGLADQGNLHNGSLCRPDLAIFEPLQFRGQLIANSGHFAHHVIEIAIDITRPLAEFDRDYGSAVGACRTNFHDIIQPLNHVLDRLSDGFFHFLRIGTGLDRDNVDSRDREMGVDRPRDIVQCCDAQHHQ